MRIAYLVNQYPQISHSFIRREIIALEEQGVEVLRIALRGWTDPLVDAQDQAESSKTHYILRDGARRLIGSLVRMMLLRPALFWKALKVTVFMSRRAERPLSVHLIYLAEACRIEPLLRRVDVKHLHAHFGTNSAEVAMLVNILSGI